MGNKQAIKLYGERNTATNYFSKLIQLNFNLIELKGVAPPFVIQAQKKLPGSEFVRDIYFYLTYSKNFGWKHSCVNISNIQKQNPKNIVFISITKNPYSWLLSLYRNPYHQNYSKKPDFNTFLQMPWKTVYRDNLPVKPSNPIELWNLKNKSYLDLKNVGGLNLTSEQIIQQPSEVIRLISMEYSIEANHGFIDFEKSAKNSKHDSQYYREYYAEERWKEDLTPESIAIINNSLDAQLMKYFDYIYLN